MNENTLFEILWSRILLLPKKDPKYPLYTHVGHVYMPFTYVGHAVSIYNLT